jgi:hypothetical protein
LLHLPNYFLDLFLTVSESLLLFIFELLMNLPTRQLHLFEQVLRPNYLEAKRGQQTLASVMVNGDTSLLRKHKNDVCVQFDHVFEHFV